MIFLSNFLEQVLNTLTNDADNFLDAFDTKEEGKQC